VRAPLVVTCALGLGVLAASAHAEKIVRRTGAPPPAPAQLDDPCVKGAGAGCTRALDGFYGALAATEAGKAAHPARISYLGDSLTADDTIAQRLRTVLGVKFGDGGPGFVHVVPPHPYCRHRAVKRTASSSWTVHGVSTPFPADRLLGYGGGSAESRGGASVRIAPVSKVVTRAEIYYLAQPGGGELDIAVDGKSATSVATAADAKKASFASVPVAAALGKLDLKASGRVRLFGVVLEADRGVVVDNLGVVNATAKSWGKNRSDHWKGQLAHRAPDLFVVMIGTNEAGWLAGNALEEHARVMQALLAPVRAANPGASCLVVSPFDQLDWEKPGLPPRASIAPMVAAQRAAAATVGCAFWDAQTWMGGPGSSRNWRRAGWLTNDFAHPTHEGANRIADALAAGLMDGYAAYRKR
jgi:lysophospholipase L1-like esterase